MITRYGKVIISDEGVEITGFDTAGITGRTLMKEALRWALGKIIEAIETEKEHEMWELESRVESLEARVYGD